jgi:AcrR family transcriptional regulator
MAKAGSGVREQQQRDLRLRILDAARRLFTERGSEGVTMAEVAEAAGVARATVFNQFGSKHALIEGITEDVLAYSGALYEGALADRDTPTPVLLRALAEFMGMGIESEERFYRGVFREIGKVQLGLDEGSPSQRASRESRERLVELMTRGQARGELSRAHRPEDLASAFLILTNGTVTTWLYDDASESLRLRMRRAIEIFLGPVLQDPSASYPEPLPDLARPSRPSPARIADSDAS